MIYVNGGIQKIYFYFSDLLKEEEEEARGRKGCSWGRGEGIIHVNIEPAYISGNSFE